MNQSIVACGHAVDIGAPVALWDSREGYLCPNRRGRIGIPFHDPILNDAPTQPPSSYRISDPEAAYEALKKTVHQFVLHYDVCYCSYHCHQVMKRSSFKGSHFYLDLDGTIYQTCDLYWKTNTAPADDRVGNERSVHVEIANLSWGALAGESELYGVEQDQYIKRKDGWELALPERYREKIRVPGFKAVPSRWHRGRGYFSGRVNGKMARMWDFTEEQYRSLIKLCIGINRSLPRVKLRVPGKTKTGRITRDRIKNFSTFQGVLGHAHVQKGGRGGLTAKYDPGSAFNWSRLRKALEKEMASRKKPGKNNASR